MKYDRGRSHQRHCSAHVFLVVLMVSAACSVKNQGTGVPPDVAAAIGSISDEIAEERYEQIYNESSDLWKHDVTLEQSTEVFKTLRSKLGKLENRGLHSATEQDNSGGALKGRAFIVTYRTKFERGEAMETFTLVEQNGRWLLARYAVNSTALK